jgi:hypothetical protein
MKLGRNGRNVGWVITALAAMVYGVGVAALSVAESPMGVLFIVFLVIPFLVWQLGGRRDADRHTIGS